MSRTIRQQHLDRVAVAALFALPGDYELPEDVLREEIRLRSHPRALLSEVDESIRYLESTRRIHGRSTEEGVKWSLTPQGRVWWEQNR